MAHQGHLLGVEGRCRLGQVRAAAGVHAELTDQVGGEHQLDGRLTDVVAHRPRVGEVEDQQLLVAHGDVAKPAVGAVDADRRPALGGEFPSRSAPGLDRLAALVPHTAIDQGAVAAAAGSAEHDRGEPTAGHRLPGQGHQDARGLGPLEHWDAVLEAHVAASVGERGSTLLIDGHRQGAPEDTEAGVGLDQLQGRVEAGELAEGRFPPGEELGGGVLGLEDRQRGHVVDASLAQGRQRLPVQLGHLVAHPLGGAAASEGVERRGSADRSSFGVQHRCAHHRRVAGPGDEGHALERQDREQVRGAEGTAVFEEAHLDRVGLGARLVDAE